MYEITLPNDGSPGLVVLGPADPGAQEYTFTCDEVTAALIYAMNAWTHAAPEDREYEMLRALYSMPGAMEQWELDMLPLDRIVEAWRSLEETVDKKLQGLMKSGCEPVSISGRKIVVRCRYAFMEKAIRGWLDVLSHAMSDVLGASVEVCLDG